MEYSVKFLQRKDYNSIFGQLPKNSKNTTHIYLYFIRHSSLNISALQLFKEELKALEGKTEIEDSSFFATLGNRGIYTCFGGYITDNGISYDFCGIEALLTQLTGVAGVKGDYLKEFQEQFLDVVKDKVVSFDYNKKYSGTFEKFILPLAKQNYGLTEFRSTNNSQRVWANLKF